MLVEAPTYDRPLILLRRAGAEPVGIPVDEHGLDVDALEDDLAPRRRAGVPLRDPDLPEPERLDAAARAARAAGRALAPLRLPDRRGRPLRPPALPRRDACPTIHSLDPDRVITMSSFTKTVAPGLRIGYAVAPADLATRLTRLRDRHLHRARRARPVDARRLRRGGQLRAERRARRRRARTPRGAMAAALREHFPSATHFVEPDGGYFLWVDLGSDGPDTTELLAAATEAGVPYVKGADFYAAARRRAGDAAGVLGGRVRTRSARASRGSPRSCAPAAAPARVAERAAPGGRHGLRRRPATLPTSLWGERVGRERSPHEPM